METTQRVLTEIASLKSRAFSFADQLEKLRDQHRQVLDRQRALARDITAAENDAKDAEGLILALVSAELDPANKPRFTNDLTRRAETRRRLPLNTEWTTASARLDALQKQQLTVQGEVAHLDDQIKTLGDRQAAFDVVVRLTIAEIAMITGGWR